ncbi:Gem-associated protein 5 [Lobosporangium transversale]|uniref:WD40-repeat-containing domain protein n=1 Tax=Lobosporangium transversale TaxID=64571 RepID=A0A1Y2GP96_9FUNG|nr:WD40-repeat-containing domain protein [Lobosporangium transversale]KAF9915740.1 Gem-associated protein 5 [Lobosporangium transversale]ORZ13372.1 WD40-repeat-containing domain protein [Lobosporangium transversale]|eukprot:XP_021880453.1 WD40-repeat-containing domain protein [Lobosporangium transversale]
MDTAFPPSPQWNQPHAACLYCLCEDTGWLLYSLNNDIHILNPFTLKYQGILANGHTARINAIASRSTMTSTLGNGSLGSKLEQDQDALTNQKTLVASCGDDLKVICWDIKDQRAVASLKKLHQKPVKAVEWTGDGRLIVSGDKGGVLAVWSPFQGKSNKKVLPEKPSISCISSSPAHPDTAAIGLDGGDILICQVNLTHIIALRRLYGHTEKIQSLSWQQLSGSGSADQSIRIWDIEKECSVRIISMPELDKKLGSSQRSKIWVPLGWTSDGKGVVSCTSRGSMVRWSLKGDTRDFVKIMHGNVHSRTVYQIMMWPLGGFAFSISMDRRIIAWDIENNQGIAQIECIGGNVYSLDISPLDPSRLAMGLGNETVKIWHTLSQDEPYECVTIDRLQSKVRVVKWHTLDEGKLCFGLENGKIGMIEDIMSGSGLDNQQSTQRKNGRQRAVGKGKVDQNMTIFQSYHEGPVISMTWCTPKVFEAPVPDLFDFSLHEATFCVVTCGSDGKILVTDTSKPTKKSLSLEAVIQKQNSAWYQSLKVIKGIEAPQRRDVAIHPNEDLLAIGNDDGSVEVFELRYFKLVYVYQGHRRRVNRLKWNWIENGGSNIIKDYDQLSYLLASGSDDGALAIHKLYCFSAKTLGGKRERGQRETSGRRQDSASKSDKSEAQLLRLLDSGTVLPTRRVHAYFSCHSRGISDLAWSPHRPAEESNPTGQKIVSVSFDGKAIVYEIQTNDEVGLSANLCQNDPEMDYIDTAAAGTVMHIANAIDSAVAQPLPQQHKILAYFDGHGNQALSAHWSLSEVDQIYTGGNDWRVCLWNWRKHEISEEEIAALRHVRVGSNPHSGMYSLIKDQATASSAADQVGVTQIGPLIEPHSNVRTGTHIEVEAAEESELPKRQGDPIPQTHLTASKRARASTAKVTDGSAFQLSTGHPPTASKDNKSITPVKGVNLFPSSSKAFRTQSKEKLHLEIIRLARNLYCRRFRQGGTLRSEAEHEAARKRWRAMRDFLEKDEEEGVILSSILGMDVDEMNLDDSYNDEDKGNSSTHADTSERVSQGSIIGPCSTYTDGAIIQQQKVGIKKKSKDQVMEHLQRCDAPEEVAATDDEGASCSDLIFYGSRESIKALAELEGYQVSKVHSRKASSQAQVLVNAQRKASEQGQDQEEGEGQGERKEETQEHHSSIFSVGSGMGVITAPVYKDSDSSSPVKARRLAQLGQIPVSYWMGDVPKMMDVLGALPASELGIHDWIGIALSPLGGVGAWKEMMKKTASKFEVRGEIHAAVLCYLGIGHVFEAIDAYRKMEMYREALMLLRIRSWENEDVGDEEESGIEGSDVVMDAQEKSNKPQEGLGIMDVSQMSVATTAKDLTKLHIQILTEWGQYLERRGFYVQASKCQLTLAAVLKRASYRQHRPSDPTLSNAVEILQATSSVGLQTLARRGDVATLRIVAGLAILLDDPSQLERISQYETALAFNKQVDKT